jgi:replicative DNA helicase
VTVERTEPRSPAQQRGGRVPPHNIEAEESLLGAMLLSRDAAAMAVKAVSAGDFYKPVHGHIFSAIRSLVGRGEPIDAVTVNDELQRSGLLDVIGDASVFVSLTANTPSIANARHYAEIVAEQSRHRQVIAAGFKLTEAGYALSAEGAEAAARHVLTDVLRDPSDRPGRLVDGGRFVSAESEVVPLWGDGEHVLWASGEALVVCGPTGVGKTSLGQQLVLGRMGLRDGPLLGSPVATDPEGIVLYLAMDRPGQAARSLRRMVSESQLDELDRRLKVWRGPPERDLARHPEDLLAMAQQSQAALVVVDSLKDAALKLSDDEVGAGWNRAAQLLLAEGVELLVLHHLRKQQGGTRPGSIDEVYGSTWLTAGAGSVILLWGSPGDPVVELSHLKQPAAPVGPFKVEHDHRTGTSTVADSFDLLRALRSSPNGLSASDAATLWFDTERPDNNDRRRAKRALDQLHDKGLAHRHEARKGGGGGTEAARYFAVIDREEEG